MSLPTCEMIAPKQSKSARRTPMDEDACSIIRLAHAGENLKCFTKRVKYGISVCANGKPGSFISCFVNQNYFTIDQPIAFNEWKKLRWCLAKDDVTPKDIFELTNGSDADRAIIAKYCIQDCNLVHSLLNKIDILTGLIEMANLCSVPISFLVLRGQGIKLTSFIAKKCREKGTLMPTLKRKNCDKKTRC